MTETLIGRLTYRMEPAELKALGGVPDLIADRLGERIDPALVITRELNDMPLIRRGIRARALWRERSRRIVLSVPFTYDVQATLGHEAIHALSDDWLTRAHRRALIPYLSPMPSSWNDLTIGDAPPVYEASPEECFASHGAAAILGVRVAFPKLYQRRIDRAHHTRVREIALAAAGALDPVAELERQLSEARAEASRHEARTIELSAALMATAAGIDVGVMSLESIDLTVNDLTQIARNARAATGQQ